MVVLHPFQCLAIANNGSFERDPILFAACGPKIYSTTLNTGEHVSQWPEDASEPQSGPVENEDIEPPAKKQKTEKSSVISSTVIKLVLSPDHQYAVAVTGEDKCIRVFEVTSSGKLVELSQRCMPKRPCAILVTPDNKTILCGDKFGDVYSLPLLQQESVSVAPSQTEPGETPKKTYAPTATNLTVHTGRNRRALEEQMRRKDSEAKTKEPLKFEHQLSLGHVSMLTDMVFATQLVNGKSQHHVITSDRDEHIRVSRAPPQAHIIERYCLGHTEFVNNLCLIPDTKMLLSAGGDDWIGAWDWTTGKLLAKHELTSSGQIRRTVAVAGIHIVPAKNKRTGNSTSLVLVLVEGASPVVFSVENIADETSKPIQPASDDLVAQYTTPIDVAVWGTEVIISRMDKDHDTRRLWSHQIEVDGDHFRFMQGKHQAVADKLATLDQTTVTGLEALGDILHGTEKLRKRGAEEGVEDGD